MKITLSNTLPPYPPFVEGIRRAPDRGYTLTPAQTATALKNALRYIPTELHEQLAPEFMVIVFVPKAILKQNLSMNTGESALKEKLFR